MVVVDANIVRIVPKEILAERILHVVVRILVEGHGLGFALGIAVAVGEARAEDEVRHRVGLPLQTEIGVEVPVDGIGGAEGVVPPARTAEEGLRVGGGGVVGVGAGEAHVAARLEQAGLILFLAVLPGEVHTGHLAADDAATATAAATSASAPAAHRAVVDIVGGADDGEVVVVHEAVDGEFGRIAVFRTVCAVGVDEPAFFHALLHREVEHRLFVAVIDAGDAAVVRLAFVGFDLLHHLRRQILHGHLGVVGEELLAVHHDLLDGLAVDGDVAVVVHFGARELLDEILEHGAFGRAECARVIDKGVFLHLHLCQLRFHHSLFHDLGVLQKLNLAEVLVLAAGGERQVAIECLIAHIAHFEQIAARFDGGEREHAVHVGGAASDL